MMLIMILIYGIIIAVDLVPLIKKKSKKDIVLLSVVLLAGIVFSTLLIKRVDIPKPLQMIEEFIKEKLKIGYKFK